MMTSEYQKKYLRAIAAKETLYSICGKLSERHSPKDIVGIRDAASAFFELFVVRAAKEMNPRTGKARKSLSAARQMADMFMQSPTLNDPLKDICLMSPESIRRAMDAALIRIVHPEVEIYHYSATGAVRFEGLSGKRQVGVSIASSLITDAVVAPESIQINSAIYIVNIKFESVSFLLDELFSALILGRVKSIMPRKRADSEEFANMIESVIVDRTD